MSALALENFDLSLDTEETNHPGGEVNTAHAHTAGYEQGYQAGWDDAIRSASDAQDYLDAELGRNLEELSFTFLEAQRHVALSLEGLVRALADKVLPNMYHDHFEGTLQDLLAPLISDCANLQAEVICSVDDLPQVETVFAKHTSLPLTVRPEASFAKNQVKLKLGHEVHEINGEELLAEIKKSIDAYFPELKQVSKNGA